jgi:hypothetical protein
MTEKPVTFDDISRGHLARSGATHIGLPGWVFNAVIGTSARAKDFNRYTPFYVSTPVVVDQLVCEVVTGAGGSAVGRMGIYNADTSWQPTSLVVDSGTFSTVDAAVNAVNVTPVLLPPGRYLTAENHDTGNTTFRELRGGVFIGGGQTDPAMGATPFIGFTVISRVFAAFSATGEVWTAHVVSGTGFWTQVLLRLSSP